MNDRMLKNIVMKRVIFYQNTVKTQVLFSFFFIFLFTLFSSFTNQENINFSKEKIYIQFDKPNYYAGENIWFKTYLVDAAKHSIETLSKVVYVELINPEDEISETKIIKINEGGGEGDFELSADLIDGEYTIRAYTNFMRNFNHSYFFRKKIYIKALRSEKTNDKTLISKRLEMVKPDIQFFPEGGHLVSGFLNRVGFKCLGADGNGIDIEGIIIDNTGKNVLQIKTTKFGMGMIEFIPEKNKLYKAVIIHEDAKLIYDFPVVLEQGIIMKIIEHKDYYKVNLQSSLDKGFNNFYIVGTQRKGVVFNAKLAGNGARALINVPKKILAQGIIQFTLFDDKSKPLSERLSFHETNEEKININITPSKQVYGTRELVELEISLDTIRQQKLQTNMSMAVTDMSTVEPDLYGLDIKSHLLLNSELKGAIEQPGYYFNLDEPDRKKNLDVLMMTQGWRQFIVNDTLNDLSEQLFLIETDLNLSGNIKNFYNHKKPAIAEVSLTYNNREEFGHEVIMTDIKGQFIFKNLSFLDTTAIIIQAKKVKQGKREKNPAMNFHIEMDLFKAPEIILKRKQYSEEFSKDIIKSSSRSVKYLESLYQMKKGTIILDEVIIETVSSNQNTLYKKKRLLYGSSSHTIDFKDITVLPTGNALNALISKVPGLSVRDDGAYLRANTSISGDNRALILLNGIPIDIDMIPDYGIDFIDILKGPSAAIFGSRGAGGVIAIYTLNGSEESDNFRIDEKRGVKNFLHPGYSQVRKFYEPVYKTEKNGDDKIDYRSTLSWNPIIKLDELGKAIVCFYTADVIAPYRVVLEGITLDGKVITYETILNLPEGKF